jgi:hypothetical protein
MSSRSFLKELKNVFLLWWQGFYDALQAQSVYRALKRDPVLRTLIFQCFLLNGVIFVGSNLLFTKGIQPLVTYLFTFEDATNSSIQSLIWLLQQFFWIAHLVSFRLRSLVFFGFISTSVSVCILGSLAVSSLWHQLSTK